MPPKKKFKPNPNYPSANPQTSSETNQRAAGRAAGRAARHAAHLEALRSAGEDFDPPFDIDENKDETYLDKDGNDEEIIDSDEELLGSDEAREADAREVLNITTVVNTFLNNGFETFEGLQVALKHSRRNLRIVRHRLTFLDAKKPASASRTARTTQDPSTEQDAPSEPVDAEE